MGCCGGDDEKKEEAGMVQQRSCRDVLCLLIFIAFWAGMFVICGIAVRQGDSGRLVYGVDSWGFTCGSKGTYKNVTLDLSEHKNLYYLNPLDLLSIVNIPYAKSVCVSGCPKEDSVCNATGLPCTTGNLYRCAYYRFAGDSVYGQSTNVQDSETQYWDSLAYINGTVDAQANQVIQKLEGLHLSWVDNWLATYNITPSTNVTGRYYQLKSQVPGQGPCYPVWVPTTEFFHRCFPSIPSDWSNSVVQQVGDVVSKIESAATDSFKDNFNSVSQKWSRYVGDISKGILIIIVAGLVGGVVISLVWLVILRYLAGLMAWLTILLVNVALCGVTLYCFALAGLLGNNAFGKGITDTIPDTVNPTALEKTTWRNIGIAAAVVAGLVLLLTLLMISRIRVAVACIKVASQAVGAMPTIILYPLLPFVLEVGLIIYWIAVTAMLYSAGDLTTNCRTPIDFKPYTFENFSNFSSTPTYTSNTTSDCYANLTRDDRISACGSDPDCYISYDWNNQLKYSFIYHFFGLLWTNQFIIGCSYVTVAGAIASFYWAGGDSSRMPRLPVLAALKNTIVYHMGSVAFGSFIIAVIQFIRFVLDYLDRKTKELQAGNVAAQWIMCCVKCCVWLLEKIVAFINRNAYIMVAVKGTNYCVSAGRAIALIVTNCLRIATVNFIGDILIFLGKITIAATCGIIAFAMCELPYYTDASKYPDTFLSSPVMPVALSILTSFVVAEIFFTVYEMAVDTIILAFCEDCEVHGGNPKFAPPLLMETMGCPTEPAHSETVKPVAQ